MIRVAICDDSKLFCDSFKDFLEFESDLILVGEAFSNQGCIEMVKDTEIDVLLLDIQIEESRDGIQLLKELLNIKKDLAIIMLTSFDDSSLIFEALTNGAKDYVLKSISNEGLPEKIRYVFNKSQTHDEDVMDKFKMEAKRVFNSRQSLLFWVNSIITLSKSEFEILKELYEGKQYSEIALERFTTESTVRTHASRILQKLEYKTMAELIEDLRNMNIFDLYK